MLPPWAVDSPNHGVKLTSAGRIVGVYLAFYSRREIEGTAESFCNLGAWCVLDAHRADSLRMVRFLLAQRGFHFTDLSPSGNVVPLNQRLKFELLDTSTALLPNRPRVRRARFRVVDDLDAIASELDEDQRRILRDHRGAAASQHVLLQGATRSCYVILRRDRRKGLPIFASLLHVSDQQVFAEAAPDLSHHLLLRHGVLFTPGRAARGRHRPFRIAPLRTTRPKMFRSQPWAQMRSTTCTAS